MSERRTGDDQPIITVGELERRSEAVEKERVYIRQLEKDYAAKCDELRVQRSEAARPEYHFTREVDHEARAAEAGRLIGELEAAARWVDHGPPGLRSAEATPVTDPGIAALLEANGRRRPDARPALWIEGWKDACRYIRKRWEFGGDEMASDVENELDRRLCGESPKLPRCGFVSNIGDGGCVLQPGHSPGHAYVSPASALDAPLADLPNASAVPQCGHVCHSAPEGGEPYTMVCTQPKHHALHRSWNGGVWNDLAKPGFGAPPSPTPSDAPLVHLAAPNISTGANRCTTTGGKQSHYRAEVTCERCLAAGGWQGFGAGPSSRAEPEWCPECEHMSDSYTHDTACAVGIIASEDAVEKVRALLKGGETR